MRLKVQNTIKYQFSNPVSYGMQRLRLWPQRTSDQIVGNWKIDLVGAKEQVRYKDHHDNKCSLITFIPHVTEIIIYVKGSIKTGQKKKRTAVYSELCPIWIYRNETVFTTAGKSITDFCQFWSEPQPSKIDLCRKLAEAIKNEMEYKIGQTDVRTSAEQSFKLKSGVCQDFAHIFLACIRHLNIPGRYVSGYLKMDDSNVQAATHAWAEAFIDNLGWVGFDIANNIDIDERYVVLARGCDYHDANPINGFHFDSANDLVINEIEVKRQRDGDKGQ